MRLSSGSPSRPVLVTAALSAPLFETVGVTTNHAMPALLELACGSEVSSEPHSLPAAKVVCIMRVSLLSRLYTFSWKGSGTLFSTVAHAGLLRQSRSGVGPDFWFEGAGNA